MYADSQLGSWLLLASSKRESVDRYYLGSGLRQLLATIPCSLRYKPCYEHVSISFSCGALNSQIRNMSFYIAYLEGAVIVATIAVVCQDLVDCLLLISMIPETRLICSRRNMYT